MSQQMNISKEQHEALTQLMKVFRFKSLVFLGTTIEGQVINSNTGFINAHEVIGFVETEMARFKNQIIELSNAPKPPSPILRPAS